MGFRCQMKPKTPSGAARFSYINRTGKYARDKADLVHTADHNMPEFARKDAMLFWESADEFERSNARICLEFELNLPTELKTLEQKIECVEKFINQLNAKAGKFPTSYAIHSDKDGQNPHVHLMISERALDGIDRPAELFFKRANTKKPELGGTKKSLFFNRSSENVLWTRAAWAEACNETLINSGFDARFDSRTKAAQRLEAIEIGDIRKAVRLSTLTEVHEGPHVGGIRKRLEAGQLERDEVDAEILEKLDSNDTIKDFNRELKLFAAIAEIEQLQAFLECEKPVERMAFIADLYTPTPAVELSNHHTEDLEHEHEHDTRAQLVIASQSNTHAGGIFEHVQHLHVVQARRNNQILQSLDIQRKTCDFSNIGNFVFTPIQSCDAATYSLLQDVRRLIAQPLSLKELEVCVEDCAKASREADDAELRVDFKSQDLQQFKIRASQLLQLIKDSEPNFIERFFIKTGLFEDRSTVFKKQVPALLNLIAETKKEVRELSELSSELRAYAERLQSKLDALQAIEPKVTPAQAQAVSADYVRYLEKLKAEQADAKVESKKQSQQAQDSQAKRPSPRRGPRF